MKTKTKPIEANHGNKIFKKFLALTTVILLVSIVSGCSKEDNGGVQATDATYSGTGNFNFSGDFTMTFTGSVENTKIVQVADGPESLGMSFVNAQGQELFIGLRSAKIQARAYTMKELTSSEGYAGIVLSGEVYDSGATGGKGTVTITTVTNKNIKGAVDMRLARPLNTADTVMVVGSFDLKAQ